MAEKKNSNPEKMKRSVPNVIYTTKCEKDPW